MYINLATLKSAFFLQTQPQSFSHWILESSKILKYTIVTSFYVLAKIDQSASSKEVSESVNVLVAIRWVAVAWSQVKEETIRKCFHKAGILGADMSVVERDEQNPFSEADEYMALQSLITQTMNTQEVCPLQEYLNGEDGIALCRDSDETCWEESFVQGL